MGIIILKFKISKILKIKIGKHTAILNTALMLLLNIDKIKAQINYA